jgi:hypothetical protein
MRHRVELISASIHWAHTEVALELSVTALGGDQVAVEVTVSSWGNYWDNRQEPRTARCRLTGTLSEAAHECVITVTPPGPVAELRFDPRKPVTSLLFGPGDTPAMPAFCEPLMAWARSQGVDASRP